MEGAGREAGSGPLYNNEYSGNAMGVAPDGSRQPNGLDLWWDQFAGNTGNCWHDNTGRDGDRASLTVLPPWRRSRNNRCPDSCLRSQRREDGRRKAEDGRMQCAGSRRG